MPMKVALRDAVRASPIGPLIRDLVIEPLNRQSRLNELASESSKNLPVFLCPVCDYRGPFANFKKPGHVFRRYAYCPNCGAQERHRLQARVLEALEPTLNASAGRALHFAPEKFFTKRLRKMYGVYKTADLFRRDVDLKLDLSNIALPDESFDLVYASHVLEHIIDDRKVLREIYRILTPGGIAILPVPITSLTETIEYGHAKPEDDGHVRAPAVDYYDRYREVFDEVTMYDSDDFSSASDDGQLYILAPSEDGRPEDVKYVDYVPVCRKAKTP